MIKSLFLLLILGLSSQASDTVPGARGTPAQIVELRMKRYNDRQLDSILELYADDVEVYKYPDQLLGKGKAHLRKVLESTFEDSTPVTVTQQRVHGKYVISEESVSYAGTAKQFTSIYEVENGLIQSVRFIRD